MVLSISFSVKYLSSPFWDDNDGKTGLGLPMGVGYLCGWGGGALLVQVAVPLFL